MICLPVRQHGHNRTASQSNFESHLVVNEPRKNLQSEMTTNARSVIPSRRQLGMCRTNKAFKQHGPLHSQLFADIRRQLTASIGDSPGKEALVSGDVLIKVSWSRNDMKSSSSSSASSGNRVEGRFYLIVSR